MHLIKRDYGVLQSCNVTLILLMCRNFSFILAYRNIPVLTNDLININSQFSLLSRVFTSTKSIFYHTQAYLVLLNFG